MVSYCTLGSCIAGVLPDIHHGVLDCLFFFLLELRKKMNRTYGVSNVSLVVLYHSADMFPCVRCSFLFPAQLTLLAMLRRCCRSENSNIDHPRDVQNATRTGLLT